MSWSRLSQRRTWTLFGGLSVAGLLLLVVAPRAEPKAETAHLNADVEPLSFVEDAGTVRLEWDRTAVVDLHVTAELSRLDRPTRQAVKMLATSIRHIPKGSPELEGPSLQLPRPDPKLMSPGENESALIAERLVATALLRGGDPRHPFMAQTRRLYRLHRGQLEPLSQKEWDALVDPVEEHLSPDGHSYRYQRGEIEIDPSFEPGLAAREPVFDRLIEGARPRIDPLMEGARAKVEPAPAGEDEDLY